MRLIAIAISVLVMGNSACTRIPATGQSDLTLISLEDDIQIGKSLRRQILAQFNGVYDDPDLTAYVASVGNLLAQTSELPNISFSFTILDTDIPNAFAAPGGDVYITRGAMAWIDNEAQLAAVLAHEIGHITARHGARQIGRSAMLNVGMSLFGAAFKSDMANRLSLYGAQLYLLKHSRDHEYESDDLSLRYLNRVGFQPRAMAGFLRKLHMYGDLQKKISQGDYQQSPLEFLSTHPSSPRRISRSLEKVDTLPAQDTPIIGQHIYLSKIQGMIYGENKEKQGYIKGQAFIHPAIGFRFEVPAGYVLRNEPTHVLATDTSPPDTKAPDTKATGTKKSSILFDADTDHGAKDIVTYMKDFWAKGIERDTIIRQRIHERDVAIASGQNTLKDGTTAYITLVAIDWDDDMILRFIFQSYDDTRKTKEERSFVLDSLRPVDHDTHLPEQRYIDIITVEKDQPLADEADQMAFADWRLDRLATLNGLKTDALIKKGTWIKVVRRQSEALPTKALPSEALPSENLPTKALYSNE